MRSAPRRRTRTLARLGGGILVAGIAVQIARELSRFAKALRTLESQWTSIPSITGWGSLRIHSRTSPLAPDASPAVVMVHGYGVASSYLVPVAARIAERLPVYVPDLPGHGDSDHDVRPLTIPELAQALGLWMETLNLRAALLVGHSMGCQVVVELAATRPDLVAGLILIGPTADVDARTGIHQITRAFPTALFERPSFYLWAAADYLRAGIRVLTAEMQSMVTHPTEQVLVHVLAPVCVVRGTRDFIAPQEWAETVARTARAPRPVLIPRWGHAAHYGDPDAVAEVVLHFAGANGR